MSSVDEMRAAFERWMKARDKWPLHTEQSTMGDIWLNGAFEAWCAALTSIQPPAVETSVNEIMKLKRILYRKKLLYASPSVYSAPAVKEVEKDLVSVLKTVNTALRRALDRPNGIDRADLISLELYVQQALSQPVNSKPHDLNSFWHEINDVLKRYEAIPAAKPHDDNERWQPIETAPKDKVILLWMSSAGRVEAGKWGQYCKYNIPHITHWQPLPAPPQQTKE